VDHAALPDELFQVFLHDGPFTELDAVFRFTSLSVDDPGLDDFLPVPGPAEKAQESSSLCRIKFTYWSQAYLVTREAKCQYLN